VKAAFPLFSSHVYTALLGSRVKPPSRTDRIQAICAQYQKPTSREMNRNSFLFFAFKQYEKDTSCRNPDSDRRFVCRFALAQTPAQPQLPETAAPDASSVRTLQSGPVVLDWTPPALAASVHKPPQSPASPSTGPCSTQRPLCFPTPRRRRARPSASWMASASTAAFRARGHPDEAPVDEIRAAIICGMETPGQHDRGRRAGP